MIYPKSSSQPYDYICKGNIDEIVHFGFNEKLISDIKSIQDLELSEELREQVGIWISQCLLSLTSDHSPNLDSKVIILTEITFIKKVSLRILNGK